MNTPSDARPTMADVARIAGVSVPTVSRVVSASAGVRADKRERVAAAIAQLGYRPSIVARTLASGHSRTVAIIAANTSVYGYAETMRGLEESARLTGYMVVIVVVEGEDPESLDAALGTLLGHSIAGVIVLKFDRAAAAMTARIPTDIPLVVLSGAQEKDLAQARIDEARGADAITTFLLELGHQTVHHVRAPTSTPSVGRTRGWRRALVRADRIIPESMESSWDPRSARAVGQTLARDLSITAVFCGNDEIAMGVMRGLADAGTVVPDQISVVGFDDHPLSELWTPALTTVKLDFADLGRRGFRLLLEVMSGRRPGSSTVIPSLITRDSAAPPRL